MTNVETALCDVHAEAEETVEHKVYNTTQYIKKTAVR